MSRTAIERVIGRRVWDSRGRPTVEAEVHLSGGATGRAIAPAGASTGSAEAVELRDGGAAFAGLDVRTAVANVSGEIAAALRGLDARDQESVDRTLIALDGTPNRARLGGNALIATSMAVLHAAATAEGLPVWRYLAGNSDCVIPLPEIQVFGGGAHAGRRVDVQDFMVVCPGAESAAQALDWTAEVYRAAGDLLEGTGRRFGVADEGGYWPAFDSNEEALEMLCRAIERAGLRMPDEAAISLDIAATQLRTGAGYRLALDDRDLTSTDLGALIEDWAHRYPVVSVEDPLAEDDEEGLAAFTRSVGSRVQVVGDDYLVTSAARIERAAAVEACNAALIKPNQAGTLTETREALAAVHAAGFGAIVSARSGESEDVSVVHLAVGLGVPQLKVGSFSRSERMAKWNELLRIEEALGPRAHFAGRGPFAGFAR